MNFADAVLHIEGGGLAHDIFVIFIFILIGLILWALGEMGVSQAWSATDRPNHLGRSVHPDWRSRRDKLPGRAGGSSLYRVVRTILFALLLLFVAGCTIPVVGNSPEEVKHRKQLHEGQ